MNKMQILAVELGRNLKFFFSLFLFFLIFKYEKNLLFEFKCSDNNNKTNLKKAIQMILQFEYLSWAVELKR